MNLARYIIVLVTILLGGFLDRWQGVAAMFLMALIASIDGWIESWRTRTVNVNVKLPVIEVKSGMNNRSE